ncbi:MAG: PASTA domain-containing protein [Owenweeksia sp.]
MKLIRFIKSKTFWANLLVAVIGITLLFWGITAILSSYTRHGENIQVPDLSRLSYEEAVRRLETVELASEILDSAEFNPEFPRGSVLQQYPFAGSLVKEGRVIKLTLNPLKPRKIELPELIEKTKRRAIYDLQSKGFEIGELEYVPYIGKDVVVDVKIKGRSVKSKSKFEKGTVVTLVLGQGLGGSLINVPYLKRLTLREAEEKLLAASLNKGSVRFDDDITDSASALVYKQYPNPSLKPAINIGQQVDIWLTNDYTKLPVDSLESLEYEIHDSLNNAAADTDQDL